uniref:CUB domain-containing protein n=1 Tax=Panagrolaimus davidi TaxID=227884 RepID=A0A914PZ00_9BILA
MFLGTPYNPYPVSSTLPTISTTTTSTNTGTSCPRNNTFTGPNAVDSPNYPNYYGSSIECEYHLNVASGNLVTLRFLEFYLKSTDYIDLYEGDNDSILLNRLHGTISSNTWFTTQYSNRMFVRFVSTAGFSNVSGWVLFFKAQQYGKFLIFMNFVVIF